MSSDSNTPLKFAPFVTCIDPSFWHRLSRLKLEVDKLSERQHEIWGYYSNKKQEGLNQIFAIDASSFNEQPDGNRLFGRGKIINANTIERYRDEYKRELVKSEGIAFVEILKSSAIQQPSLLNSFTIVSFADLKEYQFHYRSLFLAPNFISYSLVDKREFLKDVMSETQMRDLCSGYESLSPFDKEFFLVDVCGGKGSRVVSIKDGLSQIRSNEDWMFAFADSCESEHPGWPLRNFLAFISYHCKEIIHLPLKVLCLRLQLCDGAWHADNSIVLRVKVNLNDASWENAAAGEEWVGWERNKKGRLESKTANLRAFLDPIKLAETSVDLNLKLMKWQLLPDLDLDAVSNTRCLLLGAGTLGCNVARNLLSWGVRKITFVDHGHVSYSNPVRQSLYKFKDAGSPKATTAAAALKEIYPNVDSSGFVFCIPMPGHPVGEKLRAETEKNIRTLEELIRDHDATFLLVDSREGRWLPSLMAAAAGKLVINAALGFDSLLVMRHGVNSREGSARLGCYFCNDVTAPGNSSKSRTLDQQCTVTRPGMSNIAGALAAELFVSILQHPLRGSAPAESDPDSAGSSLLGIVPHSVRAFLSHYRVILPATEAFSSCVACSPKVVEEYLASGAAFVFDAINSKDYLEELCGLKKLHEESLMSDLLEYSESSESDS